MKSLDIIFALAGAALVVAGVLIPVSWLLWFGIGVITGAVMGPVMGGTVDRRPPL